MKRSVTIEADGPDYKVSFVEDGVHDETIVRYSRIYKIMHEAVFAVQQWIHFNRLPRQANS